MGGVISGLNPLASLMSGGLGSPPANPLSGGNPLSDGFSGSPDLGDLGGLVSALGQQDPMLGQLLEVLLQSLMGGQPGGLGGGQPGSACNGLGGMPGGFPGGFAGQPAGGGCPPSPCGGSNGCSASQPLPGNPSSLAGTNIYGDPHVKGPDGKHLTFKTPNGLFLNADGSEVLVKAKGAHKRANDVEVYQPGQGGAVAANAAKTDLYENQNGHIVDMGPIANFGIQGNGPAGQEVGPGQDATLTDGTRVAFNGKGKVNFT